MKVSILLGALAVQVLIIGIVFAAQFQSPEGPGQFLDFDPSSVNAMTIVSDEETVDLRKNDELWELSNGLPADQNKISDLIEKISNLNAGWPVATSASTAERFEVTEENFQKRVTLKSNDNVLADFFLGTSPGYQRVHARTDGPVYSVKLSNYEFGSKASSWLNKQLLRPEGRINRIEKIGNFVLTHSDEGWTASEEGELDSGSVESFVQRFTNLTVYEIDESELPAVPRSSFVLLDESGEFEIDLFFVEEEEDWLATSSRVAGQFGISTYIAEDMDQEFEDLLVEVEEESEMVEDVTEESEAESEISPGTD
ncbi:MAG: DUF4340 domain-containing protein [Gammaproteobacteria bacterium]|nr:DUF4340 domain-containing protein [Gammaproteobacteria bacterium]